MLNQNSKTMKQLLTMFMVLAVTVAVAQRPEPSAQIMLDEHQSRTYGLDIKEDNDELELDTLLPGNWENRTGVAGYWWSEDMGYFFGTNLYGDHGYGQRFRVSAPYEIYGALYWYVAADGTTGDVTFTIWDWDGNEPGDVIATSVVPLADIEASTTFLPDEDEGTPGAFYVDFTDEDGNPVEVTSDYVIGADVTGLDDYVPGSYRLGNASSAIGDGIETLAYINEATGWINASAYLGGAELDIAIFPLIFMEFDVTFNVDMTRAVYDVDKDFDKEQHDVYITGSHIGWPEPGSDEEYKLELLLPDEFQVVFSEGFEGGAIPAGWLNIDGNEDGYSWKIAQYGYNPVEGNYVVKSQSWTQESGAVEPDNWLITPQMNIPYGDYRLSFSVKAQDANNPAEKYSVLVSTTNTDPESFEAIHTETLTSGAWKEVVLDLDDYEEEHIYIAFRHWDCEDQFEIVLDAIKVEGTPPLVYTISLPNDEIELGSQQYKYFIVEDDPTWDFGEWEGDPNRGIMITGMMTMNDIWGEQVTYDLTFDVVDEAGNAIEDATITYDGEENEEGDYEFEAIWGEFTYTVEADGYESVTEEILIEGNTTEEVTLKLYRTLEFIVEDTEDNFVEDFYIFLYTPDGGILFVTGEDYIFEDLTAGDYEYLITDFFSAFFFTYVEIYNSITIPADVDNIEHVDSVVVHEGYWVDFHVDMNEATFFDHNDNEIPFNPNAHDVYVSTSAHLYSGPAAWPGYVTQGGMTQWPKPASDESKWLGYKLEDPDDDGIYTSGLMALMPSGDFEYKYFVIQNDIPSWDYPEYDEEGHNRTFKVVDEDVELHDVWGAEPYHVTFNVDMEAADGFDPETDVVYITGDMTDWAEPGDDPDNQTLTRVEDSMIYTITFEIPAGDYEYKYFLNDGWDGGEWEGDPNREVTVTGDMTVNDGWGDLTYTTGQIEGLVTSLFPNPANSVLNINSSEIINDIKVIDVTGRTIHNVAVEDNSTVIDVTNFNPGVYIIRIQTNKGLEHHKIQVTR